jgi:hypothetical protein
VQRETLSLALNETTHCGFAESAPRRFTVDIDELETGSEIATSATYIENRLADAQGSLIAQQRRSARLINQADIK